MFYNLDPSLNKLSRHRLSEDLLIFSLIDDVRRADLAEPWNFLALILHRCFHSQKGGGERIQESVWGMLSTLYSQEIRQTSFNWGRYIFRKFAASLRDFQVVLLQVTVEHRK